VGGIRQLEDAGASAVVVSQMRGSLSQKSSAKPAAFERANYMKVLGSYSILN
jgi:hypothetical protein